MTNINIGDAATIGIGSDSNAATVIAVSPSGRVVTVQEDRAVRTDRNGLSESQTYEYTQDPTGLVMRFSLRQNGRWAVVWRARSLGSKGTGYRLYIGNRRSYRDPSF